MLPFLNICCIKDKAGYPAKITKFEDDVKQYYAVGAKTFFSTLYVGNQKKIYSHCPKFYMPVFARKTFEEHSTGLGIFNMQGFEHRNK